MGSSPCRKNFLLGIAYLVLGKYFSGTGGTLGAETDPGVSLEKRPDFGLVNYIL